MTVLHVCSNIYVKWIQPGKYFWISKNLHPSFLKGLWRKKMRGKQQLQERSTAWQKQETAKDESLNFLRRSTQW